MLTYEQKLELEREKYRNVGRPREGASFKASIHFQTKLKKGSYVRIIAHNTRVIEPDDCVLPSIEGENFCSSKNFDYSELPKREKIRWDNASHQARAKKNYSPIYEGVLNLPRDNSLKENLALAEEFGRRFEEKFGWACVGISVHHDEGHITGKGGVDINCHAHLVFDRCGRDLENNKIIRTNNCGEKFQDLAAEVTGLMRGEPFKATGRKHLPHWQYREQKKVLRDKENVLKKNLTQIYVEAIKDDHEKIQTHEELINAVGTLAKSIDEPFKPFNDLYLQGKVKEACAGAYHLSRLFMVESKQATQEDYQKLKKLRAESNYSTMILHFQSVITRQSQKLKVSESQFQR